MTKANRIQSASNNSTAPHGGWLCLALDLAEDIVIISPDGTEAVIRFYLDVDGCKRVAISAPRRIQITRRKHCP